MILGDRPVALAEEQTVWSLHIHTLTNQLQIEQLYIIPLAEALIPRGTNVAIYLPAHGFTWGCSEALWFTLCSTVSQPRRVMPRVTSPSNTRPLR